MVALLPFQRAQNPAMAGHAGVDYLAEDLQLGVVDFNCAVVLNDQHIARRGFGPCKLLRNSSEDWLNVARIIDTDG
jgi:hypothetical protein